MLEPAGRRRMIYLAITVAVIVAAVLLFVVAGAARMR